MNRRISNCAILAVLWASPIALSAEPKIEGPEKVDAGKMVRLKIVDLPTDSTASWEARGLDSETINDTDFFAAGNPGQYEIRVTIAWLDGKKIRLRTLYKNVTIGLVPPGPIPPGPIPPNPIPPGPIPPGPTPTPVVDELSYFVVVEETSQRTAGIANLLDFTYWNTLPLASGHWRHYDKDSQASKDKNFTAQAEALIGSSQGKVNYPIVLALKRDGKLIEARPLPTTRDELRTWVQKITGRLAFHKDLMSPIFIGTTFNGMYCPTGGCPR